MTAHMRAARLTGPGRVEIVELPRPEPGPGEVRVRLEGCGVCASNLVPWSGPEWMQFPTSPGALGHEGWGHVEAVGAGVASVREGDRVVTLSGASYAECDLAAEAQLVPVPPALSDQPLPGEPLGCAMNIWARTKAQAGQTVAVVGIGFLGALLVRLAATAGAEVIAVARRPQAQVLARRMGATTVIPLEDWQAIEAEVAARTGGRMADRVIECTGAQAPLDLAARLTRERGRLVIAGYHQDGPRFVDMQLWNWRGLDVVNAHERETAAYAAGVRAALDAIVAGRIDPAPLYTHRFPLEQLGEALDAARDRPGGFVKALIAC